MYDPTVDEQSTDSICRNLWYDSVIFQCLASGDLIQCVRQYGNVVMYRVRTSFSSFSLASLHLPTSVAASFAIVFSPIFT